MKTLFSQNFYRKHGTGNQKPHGNRYGQPGQDTLARHRSSDDEQKIDEKMREAYKSWGETLNWEEKIALLRYKSPEYAAVNQALRKGDSSSQKDIIDPLDSALEKGNAPFSFTVQRGMNFDNPKAFIELLSKNIDQTFEDKAFVSTGLGEKSAFGGNVQMTIHVPEGAKGGYISIYSKKNLENEFLLPRGSVFKIFSVKETQSEIGTPKYHVEVGLLLSDKK